MGLKSESEVQQLIQLEAAKYGIILQRNNSGAGKFVDEKTGQQSFVRFGLMNTSKEENESIKSSDLIGIYPMSVHNAAGVLGVYVAIEVKKEGWVFNPKDKREQAQKVYIDFIKARGGIAGFCQSVEDFLKLIGI